MSSHDYGTQPAPERALLSRLESIAFYTELRAAAQARCAQEPRAESLQDAQVANSHQPSDELLVQTLLGADGFARVQMQNAQEARLLFALIAALREHGLPATFVYLYDEAWAPGLQLASRLRPSQLGSYRVLRDGYAFWVAHAQRGWAPHRGVYQDCRDAEGAASVLNVWLPFVDVAPENACMHCVPLARDPHYPQQLDILDYTAESVTALPVAAGCALVWNANLLHWGGLSNHAFRPRVNATYTLAAEHTDTAQNVGTLLPVQGGFALDFRARLDFVAEQLRRYQSHQALSPTLERWASMTLAAQHFARLSK